jgi:hypothetical protein
VREEVVPDVVLDVARRRDDDAPHQEQEQAADQGDAEQQAGVHQELALGDGLVQIVDRVLQDPGAEQLERGGGDDADETDDERAPVTIDVRQEPAGRWGQHRSKAYMKEAPDRSPAPL